MKADSESVYLAKLLLSCNMELKYVYIYKKNEVDYIINKIELAKIAK